ncbi:hypothetical protein [Roseibacillus persicicus]|uniref:Uncharacterized protein n=1 Tax=Roseibacillus persicicus TaxID=454148 RepID=A0A918TW82_9BACT|nr:hypothetical protein [Roseibacillus persicicus]GHC65016.1 hypothetical protein GCM10007100_36040 [Roseibacillus persicicus]
MELKKHENFLFFGAVTLLLALFFLPPIENRTEAEDAYSYALDVETQSFGQLLHRNHRLYHPFAKAVYLASGQERSFKVLVAFSGITAVAALVIFFFLCLRFTKGERWQGLAWTCCLAFSYGFWRYGREVEAYSLAWLVSLAVIACLFRSRPSWSQGVFFALLVVLALNFHRALGPPLAVTALSYLLLKKQWKPASIALISGVGIYFFAEEIAQSAPRAMPELREVVVPPEEVGIPRAGFEKKTFSVTSIPKAGIGLGGSLFGGNIVMSSNSLFEILQNKVFRYRFLHEERMMVRDVGRFQLWIWVSGFLATASLIGIAIKAFFEHRKFILATVRPEGGALLLGSLSYVGMIVVFEPGNPEMWVLGLPFFWLSIVMLFGDIFQRKVWIFVLFFGGTIYFGGVSLLKDVENDYHYATSELVRKKASNGDFYLLGTNNMVHVRYVRYQKNLRVISVLGGEKASSGYLEDVRAHLEVGGRVFVHQSYRDSFEDLESFLSREGLAVYSGADSAGGGEIHLETQE